MANAVYLIDPFVQLVTPVELSEYPTFDALKTLCGFKWMEFTHCSLGHDHKIMLNEEGLVDDSPKAYFTIFGNSQPLCGRAILLQCGVEDDRPRPAIPGMEDIYAGAQIIQTMITWPAIRFAGHVTTEGSIDHPIFGRVAQISMRAVYEELPDNEDKQ